MKARPALVVLLLLLLGCLPSFGQWKEPPATGSPPNRLPDRTTLAGQTGLGPLLIVTFVDRDLNAKKHRAVIDVQTDGLTIVDPAAVHYEPRVDEAHIQYRLDNGTIQNTTSKNWTFDNLSPGRHIIRVALASSDSHQLGKVKTLKINVP